jgi:hypothetical protein
MVEAFGCDGAELESAVKAYEGEYVEQMTDFIPWEAYVDYDEAYQNHLAKQSNLSVTEIAQHNADHCKVERSMLRHIYHTLVSAFVPDPDTLDDDRQFVNKEIDKCLDALELILNEMKVY